MDRTLTSFGSNQHLFARNNYTHEQVQDAIAEEDSEFFS
jgi:hypothetical protein